VSNSLAYTKAQKNMKDMKRKVTWIAVTILLGALGSGLWEVAVKPIMLRLTTFAVDLLSYVFTNFQNNIYNDIAKGNVDRTGRLILALLSGGCIGIFIGNYSKLKKASSSSNEENKNKSVLMRRELLAALFALTFLSFNFTTTTFVIDQINKFEQSLSIAAPFLDQREILIIRSKFSQLKSKEEYIALMKRLHTISEGNKQYFPKRLIP